MKQKRGRTEERKRHKIKTKGNKHGGIMMREICIFFINDIFEWFFGLDVKGDLKHSDLILNNFAPNTSKNQFKCSRLIQLQQNIILYKWSSLGMKPISEKNN